MKFVDMYPKDRFYAADFKGKPVTLTFRANDPVTSELLGKGGPSEKMLPIWHFKETPKKLPAVVTNGVCARALFGDESDDWAGHKITLYPAPDPSGMSDDGLCIRVLGSPELKKPLTFNAQIGRTKKTFTLKPTGNGKQPAPVTVDEDTGEVFGFTDDAPDAAGATESGQNDDASTFADTEPYEDSGAANAVSEDEEPPGRGALFPADDPNRPATSRDKKALSEAIAHVPAAKVKAYRQVFGGRANSELSHGNCVAFAEWAVKEALS